MRTKPLSTWLMLCIYKHHSLPNMCAWRHTRMHTHIVALCQCKRAETLYLRRRCICVNAYMCTWSYWCVLRAQSFWFRQREDVCCYGYVLGSGCSEAFHLACTCSKVTCTSRFTATLTLARTIHSLPNSWTHMYGLKPADESRHRRLAANAGHAHVPTLVRISPSPRPGWP